MFFFLFNKRKIYINNHCILSTSCNIVKQANKKNSEMMVIYFIEDNNIKYTEANFKSRKKYCPSLNEFFLR